MQKTDTSFFIFGPILQALTVFLQDYLCRSILKALCKKSNDELENKNNQKSFTNLFIATSLSSTLVSALALPIQSQFTRNFLSNIKIAVDDIKTKKLSKFPSLYQPKFTSAINFRTMGLYLASFAVEMSIKVALIWILKSFRHKY